MRQNITLRSGEELPFKGFFFSGGEPHIEIQDPENLRNRNITIDARVGSSQDMMMLLAVTDAVERCQPGSITLLLPYFPGARQDREEPGYALTAKVFADLINAQGYDQVFVLDPHSPVTPALLDRVAILSPIPLIRSFLGETPLAGVISPDAGAKKRTLELATELGCDIVFASKKRNPRTGALSGFSLDPLPSKGTYLLADDLCDGGGTFIGLAGEYLKDPKGTGSLLLWTTHGIFSKGLNDLSKYFDRIGCSDSFPSRVTKHSQLQVVSLLDAYLYIGGK